VRHRRRCSCCGEWYTPPDKAREERFRRDVQRLLLRAKEVSIARARAEGLGYYAGYVKGGAR
jgi:hypothetical protein